MATITSKGVEIKIQSSEKDYEKAEEQYSDEKNSEQDCEFEKNEETDRKINRSGIRSKK